MSSGSSRAASSVEPTRSTNITVSCRRSASRGGAGRWPASLVLPSRSAGSRRAAIALSSLLRWPSGTPSSSQILIVEVREDLMVDRVLGEDRRILGKPDLAPAILPCHPAHSFRQRPFPDDLRQPTPVAAVGTGQALGAGVGHTLGRASSGSGTDRRARQAFPDALGEVRGLVGGVRLVVDQASHLQLRKRHAGCRGCRARRRTRESSRSAAPASRAAAGPRGARTSDQTSVVQLVVSVL